MIPNTDINCGKCAAPIYSDCVMWSGGNLSCVTLLQDCCDTTLTKVIELLGNYVCNLTNVANYTIPVCMESYSITDFVGMQNAMMDLLCQQHDINVTGLTWGCTPSGTTTLLQDTIQAVINEVNTQSISYSTDYFVVTNTETCPPKNLEIKQGQWTNVDLETVTFYNGFSGYTGASFYGLQYLIEPATNTVRLRGLLYRPVISSMTSITNYGGSGVGILVCDIPIPGIIPAVTTPTDYKDVPTFAAVGFNNTYLYNQGSAPTQHYNLVWNIVLGNNGAGALRIAAYIPYGATQNGASTAVGNNGYVSFYLHPVHYTLN